MHYVLFKNREFKGKLKEARVNLIRLRGPDYPVEDELKYLIKSYAFVNNNQGSFW